MFILYNYLKFLFTSGYTASLGCSFSDGKLFHCLIANKKNKSPLIISLGERLPWYVRLLYPSVVSIDLDNLPFSVQTYKLDGISSEEWLEQNEQNIIPQSMDEKDLSYEYVTYGDWITVACVHKNHLKNKVDSFSHDFEIQSGTPELWNVAKLASLHIKENFLLFKIGDFGSILAFVKNGRINSVVNFWASQDDFSSNPKEITNQLQLVIESILNKQECTNIYTINNVPDVLLESLNLLKKWNISPLQLPLKLIPSTCYEAYANALYYNDYELNFVDFNQLQNVKKFLNPYKSVLSSFSLIITTVFVLLIISGIVHGGIFLYELYNQKNFIETQKQEMLFKALSNKKETLHTKIQEKHKFLNRESSITYFLSDLQRVFPDGVWADEIAIQETENNTWKCEIRAQSPTTANIGQILKNINSLKKVSDCRLIYSEEDRKKTNTVLKFKIQCVISK